MNSQSDRKINRVIQDSVPGTVLTSQWLAGRDVSKDLVRRYVSSGWLARIGYGAYKRVGDAVDWQGAVYALQSQLKLNVYVAGLSALRLKGLGHYLALHSENAIQLFSDANKLPVWFRDTNWGDKVEHRCVNLFDLPTDSSLSQIEHKTFRIKASSPERAAFELLYCVRNNADFDLALTVFEGLGTLRPTEVQTLLGACRSVKVKRMFLWMAQNCMHPWFKYVEVNSVYMGKGKRVIYAGGVLDRELQITVPRSKDDADV
jgi:hypothetical protein